MKRKQSTATKVITIDDEKYTIGMVPRREFQSILARITRVFSVLKPKDETESKDPQKIAERLAAMPEEKLKEANVGLSEGFRDLVRLSLRNHEGVLDEKGDPIPFLATLGAVDEELLETYEISGILHKIAIEALLFNVLNEVERKNS